MTKETYYSPIKGREKDFVKLHSIVKNAVRKEIVKGKQLSNGDPKDDEIFTGSNIKKSETAVNKNAVTVSEENLQEISKELKLKYINKAVNSLSKANYNAGKRFKDYSEKGEKEFAKNNKIVDKRESGIRLASKKLAKEENSLDESSDAQFKANFHMSKNIEHLSAADNANSLASKYHESDPDLSKIYRKAADHHDKLAKTHGKFYHQYRNELDIERVLNKEENSLDESLISIRSHYQKSIDNAKKDMENHSTNLKNAKSPAEAAIHKAKLDKSKRFHDGLVHDLGLMNHSKNIGAQSYK